jgi:hypothetical protein
MSLGGPGPATGIVVQQHMTSIAPSIRAAVRRLWSHLAPLRHRVEPLQVVADLLCLAKTPSASPPWPTVASTPAPSH